MNLREEVIRTLLLQSDYSESATANMFCYWLKYLLLTVQMWRFVHRVCVWERERERAGGSYHSGVSFLNRGLCTVNTYEHHHCVCHVTLFLFWAWTDGKTKDIINSLYNSLYFESWSSRLWKGMLHFRLVLVVFGQSQCTVSAVCQKKGLCRKWSVWERRGIEELQ